MTRERRPQWHLGLTALLMLGAILAALIIHWQNPPPDPLTLLPPLPLLPRFPVVLQLKRFLIF